MNNLWQALLMVRRCDSASFRRRLLYVVLSSLLPLANLYILKLLVDSVTDAVRGVLPATVCLPYLLAMVGVFLLNRAVAALNGINNDVLAQRLIDYMSDLVQRQAARLDMAYYDTPAYHDTLHRAQQEAGSRPIRILDNSMAVIGSLISIVGVVALLVTASWWVVVVMIVAVLPSFAVRLYKARSIYAFRRANTQLYRRTAYYGSLLTSREAAKEMRAYRLAPLFRRLFVEVRGHLVSRLLRISRRLGAADILCAVVEAAAMLLVVWLLVRQTVAAAITLGSFVMLFEAFRRGQGYLSALVAGIAGLYDNRLFISNLFEFLALEPTVLSPEKPEPMPERIETIEFRNVTFRYPDMDRDVLQHFNLTARVGEVTRIAGRNGYGKSTLVKLLLRFYDPQQGAVLINGTDLRRFDPEELRRHMGVLFQDFLRFNCTAADNIAFGDIDHPEVSADAAARMAGADGVVDRLPQGYATPLGRMFDGGAELSMGQWQRVATARALQGDAPILLLDEPLAWLDNDSRRHLLDTLDTVCRNKIVIMITHT
ncbi:MAG: ABC transporter ATP-binding protein [Bacteroidales bacterium]|nr:ABC transporter ATP-binding protein [Bacteroidales bacterium]